MRGEMSSSPTNIDSADLEHWADRRDAQGRLPELIRRIILATIPLDKIIEIQFRGQEGIQIGGWDGKVVTQSGTPYVPEGLSVWELSTDKDVKQKAEKNYAKRCIDPIGINPKEAVYIFATPRRWGAKEKWATKKRADGAWR